MYARARRCNVLPRYRRLDVMMADEPVYGGKGAAVETGGTVEEAAGGGGSGGVEKGLAVAAPGQLEGFG